MDKSRNLLGYKLFIPVIAFTIFLALLQTANGQFFFITLISTEVLN